MQKLLSLPFFLAASTALADVPQVATDIAPVHGLVSRVMQGVGTPELIVPAGATPHDFALRPSQARALQNADLVVWMGPALARPDARQPLAGRGDQPQHPARNRDSGLARQL